MPILCVDQRLRAHYVRYMSGALSSWTSGLTGGPSSSLILRPVLSFRYGHVQQLGVGQLRWHAKMAKLVRNPVLALGRFLCHIHTQRLSNAPKVNFVLEPERMPGGTACILQRNISNSCTQAMLSPPSYLLHRPPPSRLLREPSSALREDAPTKLHHRNPCS